MEPMDALAYIGLNPGDENVWVVTGDSGNGMTHGVIAGMLIRDLVLEQQHPWATLYDPSRKSLRARSSSRARISTWRRSTPSGSLRVT
jgi:glycine/D-amino acid oxidase-like deaminating enzyme